MDLIQNRKLLELQMQSENAFHNIQELRRNYEIMKIEQEFENIERYKPITNSNKEIIREIEKKNDQLDEGIVKSLPYYNENKEKELLPLATNKRAESADEYKQVNLDVTNRFIDNEKGVLEELRGKSQILLITTKKKDKYIENIDIIPI